MIINMRRLAIGVLFDGGMNSLEVNKDIRLMYLKDEEEAKTYFHPNTQDEYRERKVEILYN